MDGDIDIPLDYQVAIVGAGHSGLALHYYLKNSGLSIIHLDEQIHIGDNWRNRYDSLQLFSPKAYSQLPGSPMPSNVGEYPSKDEFADYLQSYAAQWKMNISMNTKVVSVTRLSSGFEVTTPDRTFTTHQLVCAGGQSLPHIPTLPGWKKTTSPPHLHSANYKRPDDLPEGRVLVIGGGNSGAQIALELSQLPQYKVSWSLRHPLKTVATHILGISLFKWFDLLGIYDLLTVETKLGKRLCRIPEPIVGHQVREAVNQQQISLHKAVTAWQDQVAVFADGQRLTTDTVVWCTGFRGNWEWLNIPGVFDDEGIPYHQRGISPIKGLYFLGIPWQYKRTSGLIMGISEDAARISGQIKRALTTIS